MLFGMLSGMMSGWYRCGSASERRGARLGPILLALFFSLAFDVSGQMQGEAVDVSLERSVKAAYLYKFLAFVEWPAESFAGPDAPVMIGVVDADSVVEELEQLIPGRMIDGRPLAVRKLQESDASTDVHLLFIGWNANNRLGQWVRLVQSQPALVVCESPRAFAEGCAVNFVLVDGRLRFEVSPQAAENVGLELSSRLLAVASSIRGAKP